MVVERLRELQIGHQPGSRMKRSLFLQILVRAAVACTLLCVALWLAQNLWVGILAGLAVSFLLASSIVRLCRQDEAALEAAVFALGEGRELQLQPAFAEHDRMGVWSFEPILHHAIDERLYRFIVEFQISVHISLQRDVMGPSFAPSEIALTYPRAKDFWLAEESVGCPVRYEQAANQMIFDSKWLDDPPKLGNRTTYTAVEKLCDELLSDLALRTGVAGKIRMILLRDMANRPSFAAIARLLGVTTRTLRRQLHQGMSFRQLVDDLRTQVAVKYLRETIMTNEDIALALGFSDASNFRHAFRRSTGKTPSEFRRKAHSLDHQS